MKKILIALSLFLLSPLVSNAESFRYSISDSAKTPAVTGVGEYVLTEEQSLESAYLLAEERAKIDASRKLGEYIEVLKITDTETGEVKEVTASVTSTIMKYSIVSREIRTGENEVIAYVEISATAESGDMEAAINRYFSSADYKEEIERLNQETDILQDLIAKEKAVTRKLKEARALANEKLEIGRESREGLESYIQSLEYALRMKQRDVKKQLEVYSDVQRVLRTATYESVDAPSIASAKLNEASQLEGDYLDRLQTVVDSMNIDFKHSTIVRPEENRKIVILKPMWRIPHELVTFIHSGQRDPNYKHIESSYNDNVKMFSWDLDESAQSMVESRYAIIFLIKVNDKTIEIPVLLPVQNNLKFNKHETCSSANPLTDGRGFKYVCFNFEHYALAIDRNATIAHKKLNKGTRLILEFGIEEDVQIETSVEIRSMVYGSRNK